MRNPIIIGIVAALVVGCSKEPERRVQVPPPAPEKQVEIGGSGYIERMQYCRIWGVEKTDGGRTRLIFTNPTNGQSIETQWAWVDDDALKEIAYIRGVVMDGSDIKIYYRKHNDGQFTVIWKLDRP